MNEDDRELFRQAMRGVRPLHHRGAVPARPRRPARALLRRADERRVLEESLLLDAAELEVETGEMLAWRRPGVPEATLRRLRRGHYAVRGELDLHGLRRDEARLALGAFLAAARQDGRRCLRIVHGKGLRSGHRGPVLKAALNGWLRRYRAVQAFCSARQPDGGTGAIYVLLDG